MPGCFAATDEEVNAISRAFDGTFEIRNRCIWLMSCYTGFRANEILSLRLGDVYHDGNTVREIRVKARNMKGKGKSRTVRLNPQCCEILKQWIGIIMRDYDCVRIDSPLWPTASGKPLNYWGWWHAHRKAAKAVMGANWEPRRFSSHISRKTFYRVSNEELNAEKEAGIRTGENIYALRDLLGHADIRATANYAPEPRTESITQRIGKKWNTDLTGGN